MASERNRAVLLLAVAGMEACLLYGALLMVNERACEQCLPTLSLLAFYPAGFGIKKCLRRWSSSEGFDLVALWLTWLLAVLITIKVHFGGDCRFFSDPWLLPFLGEIADWSDFPRPELLILASSAILWGCGARLAGVLTVYSTLLKEFQFGVTGLLVVFFMESQWDLGLPGLPSLTLGFFLFALLGMTLAHALSGFGWFSGGQKTGWLGLAILSIGLVLGAGILASLVLRPELLNLLVSLLKKLWEVLSLLIQKLFALLAALMPDPEPYSMPLPATPSPADKDPAFIVKLLRIPDSVRKVAGFVVALMWLGLFLAALWSLSSSILAWLRRKAEQSEGVSVEPLSGAFLEDLVALVRFALRKFMALLNLAGRWLGRKGGRPTTQEASSAREIYRQLLAWAARKGCPRHPSETPGEYLRSLVRWIPERRWELTFITRQYVQARYAPCGPAQGALQKAADNWQRVRQFRRRRGETRD